MCSCVHRRALKVGDVCWAMILDMCLIFFWQLDPCHKLSQIITTKSPMILVDGYVWFCLKQTLAMNHDQYGFGTTNLWRFINRVEHWLWLVCQHGLMIRSDSCSWTRGQHERSLWSLWLLRFNDLALQNEATSNEHDVHLCALGTIRLKLEHSHIFTNHHDWRKWMATNPTPTSSD